MSNKEVQLMTQHVESCLQQYFDSLGTELPSGVYEMVLAQVEEPLLRKVLEYSDNNQSQAAKILGINRNTLRKKLGQYNIVQSVS